jgi:hypothetical protein
MLCNRDQSPIALVYTIMWNGLSANCLLLSMHFDNAHNFFLQRRRVNWQERKSFPRVVGGTHYFLVILFIYSLALSDALEENVNNTTIKKLEYVLPFFVFGANKIFSTRSANKQNCIFLPLTSHIHNRNVHIFILNAQLV